MIRGDRGADHTCAPDLSTSSTTPAKPQLHCLHGVYPAVILVAIYVPVTIYLRRVLGLPLPDPAPWSPVAHPDGFTPRYWLIWLVSWVLLLAPGLLAFMFRHTRQAATVYTITAGAVGGLFALATAYLEYDGFMGPT